MAIFGIIESRALQNVPPHHKVEPENKGTKYNWGRGGVRWMLCYLMLFVLDVGHSLWGPP